MSNNFFPSLINGLGRKTGFTLSSRSTEALGKKLLNPKSKFRRKINNFELTGEFKTSFKKVRTLVEVFYEEYKINDLPTLQAGSYLKLDIKLIQSKIDFLSRYIDTEEDEFRFEELSSMWNTIKEEVV
jgi:hypothetical protein